MKRKVLSVILSTIMVLAMGIIPANAASTSSLESDSVVFLNEFLSNLKEGNYDKAFSAIEDARYELNDNVTLSDVTDDEKAYIDYLESGKAFQEDYLKEPIVDYSIIGETDNDIILTELSFEDGSVAIVPFCVQAEGESFKIQITENDLDEMGYVQVKSPEKKIEQKELSSKAGTWKDDYTFTYLYGTIYGIDSFSVSKNAIEIDGYQANYMLSSGWESKAEVIYAVVVEHWYGDYVWATTSNAIVKNGSFSVTIIGKNSSQSDLVIRISNQTGAYPRSEGYGSLYSVTV